jgi:hypothetical protein
MTRALQAAVAAILLVHTTAFTQQAFGRAPLLVSTTFKGTRASCGRRPTAGIARAQANSNFASDLLPFVYLADEGLAEEAAPPSRPSRPSPLAPIIILFDERRGCSRVSNEYRGKMTGTDDDKMCIKVYMDQVVWTKVSIYSFLSPQI